MTDQTPPAWLSRDLVPGQYINAYALSKEAETEALVECQRTSSQETVEALHRRGLRIVREG